jgi:hypothetical protein
MSHYIFFAVSLFVSFLITNAVRDKKQKISVKNYLFIFFLTAIFYATFLIASFILYDVGEGMRSAFS